MAFPSPIERAARRSWRQLRRRYHQARRRLTGPAARFVYDRRYELSVSGVPHDIYRADQILSSLAAEGLVTNADILRPRPASFRDLSRVHTTSYLDELQDVALLQRVLGVEVTPRREDEVVDIFRLMTGGTIAAVRAAFETGLVGINLAGGFHHAHPDHGHGFCLFNDVAVAIQRLRSGGFSGRVLVIDLDLHDGDGTRACFRSDPEVHTFSIHNHDMDDGYQAVEDTRIALGTRVRDQRYLDVLFETLPRVIRSFRPDLVIYLAGVDPSADDRIGDWEISAEGLLRRDRFVLQQVRGPERSLATAIVLGGGYGPHSWRPSVRFFSHLLTGRAIEPRTTEEATLARIAQLRRLLEPAQLQGDLDTGDLMSLSEEDLMAGLSPSAAKTRFLNYYSKHGLELAFEKFGLFDRLRALGFAEPCVRLQVGGESGDLLRIYGGEDETAPLVELLALRDRRAAPGMELLRVEWLLMQNPRARFSERRPRLPGQAYPGLGFIDEVMGMLLSAAMRLGLDGVLFVPSHYHIALQAHAVLRFLSPEDAARFDALQEAVRGLDVSEASWAVEDRRVRIEGTDEPFVWSSMPMVLPLNERLRAQLESEEYRARYQATSFDCAYELDPSLTLRAEPQSPPRAR